MIYLTDKSPTLPINSEDVLFMAAVLTFTMSLIKLVLKNLGSEDRSDDLSFLMCGRNVDYKKNLGRWCVDKQCHCTSLQMNENLRRIFIIAPQQVL